jgi:3-oxoadipate enol-lactonase
MIPGVQGRWEWMMPALVELAKSCRTISYSLPGDIGSRRPYSAALGFDNYLLQLEDVLKKARLERAALLGTSFGGFVATRYTALRPEQVTSLVLVSAPGPGWSPSEQQTRWLARPWSSMPIFVLTAPLRAWPEIRSALGSVPAALRFLAEQGIRAGIALANPSLMSARVRDARGVDLEEDCARIRTPTLVMTGDQGLDRVVPVESTKRYLTAIKAARYEQMTGTGHLGMLTQPQRFARLVSEFVHAQHH